MATIAESLAFNYSLARREIPGLRKGQYMQQAYPKRYKNEASAYQAYNQTIKKRRPGTRLAAAAEPPRFAIIRDKRAPLGGYRKGLWNVAVHFDLYDDDGNLTAENQLVSFNVQSSEHTTFLAIPYLQEALLPVAEDYLFNLKYNAKITYIEVRPINTFQRTALDLDEMYI